MRQLFVVFFLFLSVLFCWSNNVQGQNSVVETTKPSCIACSDGVIKVDWNSKKKVRVRLLDANGRELEKTDKLPYKFVNLPSGVYTVVFEKKKGKHKEELERKSVVLDFWSYCESSGWCDQSYYLENVSIGNINNRSTCDGYSLFTNQSADLEVGMSYQLNLLTYNPNNYAVYYAVWIDWNQDESFDFDEMHRVEQSGNRIVTTIFVPKNAKVGLTRMRVQMMNVPNQDPCLNNNVWSEVEDYTVFIKEKQVPEITVADCLGAKTICDAVYDERSPEIEGQGSILNELPIGDCIPDEKNGIWYSFSPQNKVDSYLKFSIDPKNDFDDYDWAIFDVTNVTCDDISKININNSEVFVSGNTYGARGNNGSIGADSDRGYGNCNGPGLNNGSKWNSDILVKAGHVYMLYVSNWSESSDGYVIRFDEGGSAIIYDDVVPDLHGLIQACYGSKTLSVEFSENIVCGFLKASNCSLVIGGVTYAIVGIDSDACAKGGAGSDKYVFELGRAISSSGSANLKIISGGIRDMCGNVNPYSSNLAFEVSNLEANLKVSNQTICKGEEIVCEAIGKGGVQPYTYQYFLNGSSINNDSNFQILENELRTKLLTNGDKLYVNISDGNFCEKKSNELLFLEGEKPDISSVNFRVDQSVCENSIPNLHLYGLEHKKEYSIVYSDNGVRRVYEGTSNLLGWLQLPVEEISKDAYYNILEIAYKFGCYGGVIPSFEEKKVAVLRRPQPLGIFIK